MPLYHYVCLACGQDEDVFSLSEIIQIDGRSYVPCPTCGVPAPVLVGATMSGVPPMQQFVVPGTDIACHSQAEVEAWKKDHPAADVLVPGTPERRNFDDQGRAKLDAHARRLGFRHWDDCKRDRSRQLASRGRVG